MPEANDVPTLGKDVIGAWRDFAVTPYFNQGLEFLRRYHIPRVNKGSVEDMMHDSISAQAYRQAIDDLERILTTLPPRPERPDNDTLE